MRCDSLDDLSFPVIGWKLCARWKFFPINEKKEAEQKEENSDIAIFSGCNAYRFVDRK